jgi:hypothetical protein
LLPKIIGEAFWLLGVGGWSCACAWSDAMSPNVNPPANAAPPFRICLRLACLEPIGPSGIEPIGLSLEKCYDDEITSPSTTGYASLSNLASAHEQGLADFATPTFAAFLPRGASEPIIRKLNQGAFATADTPSVQERLNVRRTASRSAYQKATKNSGVRSRTSRRRNRTAIARRVG